MIDLLFKYIVCVFFAYNEKIPRKNRKKQKLAGLIRVCGFLMQTKAYLLWKKEN